MNKTTTPTTPREGGFTLLELLLVIGVAALLLIGGIATYRLVSQGNKATESVRLLMTIRQEANVMAQQGGGTYEGISQADLVSLGVIPQSGKSAFGGDITVSGGTDRLTITFADVPKGTGCTKLAGAVTSADDAWTTPAGAPDPEKGLSPSAIAAACTGAQNTLTWEFK